MQCKRIGLLVPIWFTHHWTLDEQYGYLGILAAVLKDNLDYRHGFTMHHAKQQFF
eukprot:c15643_g1_i1 orf=63-227(+)